MDGVAEWNGSEDAKYYELRVYRDEKFLSTVKPGKETKYNLGRRSEEHTSELQSHTDIYTFGYTLSLHDALPILAKNTMSCAFTGMKNF